MLKTAAMNRSNAAEESASDVTSLIRLVGDRVRAARKQRQLSRRELSERSGVSPRYLAQLESGEGNISIGLLKRVAVALGQPIEALVGEDDPMAAEVAHVAALYKGADAAMRARVLQILDPERLRVQKAERIGLIGLRGAGKSTLGALAAQDLQVPFVELNAEIEASAGMPVREIIAMYGEEGFRQLEAEVLDQIVSTRDRVILAVGGGAVAAPATFETLLARFHTVWIKATPGEHMDRVRAQGDLRPMAGNPQALVQLREILKARESQYRRAEHTLDTSGRTVDESQAELRNLIASTGILLAKSAD